MDFNKQVYKLKGRYCKAVEIVLEMKIPLKVTIKMCFSIKQKQLRIYKNHFEAFQLLEGKRN